MNRLASLAAAMGVTLGTAIPKTTEVRTAQTVVDKPRLDSAHHRNKWLRRFKAAYTPLSNEACKRAGLPHQGLREMTRRQPHTVFVTEGEQGYLAAYSAGDRAVIGG